MTKQEFEAARDAMEPADSEVEKALLVIPVAAVGREYSEQVPYFYRYVRELAPGRLVYDDAGYRVTVSVSLEKVEQ